MFYSANSCFQRFKDTKMKANHNSYPHLTITWSAVSNGSKIRKWKQITTLCSWCLFFCELFPTVQRYENESKSQHAMADAIIKLAVSNGSKIRKWKQITTVRLNTVSVPALFPTVQRYENESKSQRDTSMVFDAYSCFQRFKDTKMKANHNSPITYWKKVMLFPTVQRYENESKSQRWVEPGQRGNRCFQRFKDTKMKANHN